ncbi:hypothetical protein BJX99DRAFT_254616 [Aspergillus californicus]
MKLRATVRPPQRLDEDLFYFPLSQRSLRASSSSEKLRRFIDYDPNHPPSAFPTLEIPSTTDARISRQRDTGDNNHDGAGDGEISDENQWTKTRKNLDDLYLLTKPDSQIGTSEAFDVENVSLAALERHTASNGNLNPVYMSNMARMASGGEDGGSLVDVEMEDSDPDEALTVTVSPSPTWADLSPRMQVEIFSNLLDCYSRPSVHRMLGLTVDERNAIQKPLDCRAEQTEVEDLELKAMREKQLKELLKLNNSAWNLSQPHQLVFRKATRQSIRKLRETIQTDFDFLCCEGSELAEAKKYLLMRGIDPRYAGNWGNDLVVTQHPDDDSEVDAGPSRLNFSPGPVANVDIDQPFGNTHPTPFDKSTPRPSTSSTAKQGFIKWFRGAAGTNKTSPPSRRLNTFFKICIKPAVLLQNKRKRAETDPQTPVCDLNTVNPNKLYLQTPPLDCFYTDDLALKLRQSQSAMVREKRKKKKKTSETEPRQQPYKKNDAVLSHLPAAAADRARPWSIPVRSRHTKQRNESATQFTVTPGSGQPRAPLGKAMGADNGPNDRNNCINFQGLVKTSKFITLSPSPTPERAVSPTSSEELFFAFSEAGTPQTVATTIEASPPLSAYLPEPNLVKPSSLPIASAVSVYSNSVRSCNSVEGMSRSDHACYAAYVGNEDEKEDSEHADEVVLLPTKLGLESTNVSL